MKGLYIGYEGGEGSGKSTQAKLTAEWLKKQGYNVILCKEPGKTPIGEAIREILLQRRPDYKIPEMTKLFLFEAARNLIIKDVIQPELQKGNIIISDRYALTSLAYQGIAGGLGKETVQQLNDIATEKTYPDATFLINIDPEEGLKKEEIKTSISDEGKEYHKKANAAYLELAKKDPKIKIIPYTDGAIEEMQKKIQEHLTPILREAEENGDIIRR